MSKSIVEWVWTDEDKNCSEGYVGRVQCYTAHKTHPGKYWVALFCWRAIGQYMTASQAKRACEKHLPEVIDDIMELDREFKNHFNNEKEHGAE